MSAEELVQDVLHGNLNHAYSRLKDWYAGWPPQLKAFIDKFMDDEGAILWSAAETALASAGDGKNISEIADETWETIKDQVPSKAKSDLLDALGVQSRAG